MTQKEVPAIPKGDEGFLNEDSIFESAIPLYLISPKAFSAKKTAKAADPQAQHDYGSAPIDAFCVIV